MHFQVSVPLDHIDFFSGGAGPIESIEYFLRKDGKRSEHSG